MSFCIYKICNTVNDLIYVGRTDNLHKRWLKHKSEMNLGSIKLLHQAMRQYGIDNFYPEIIEECQDYPTSRNRETYWIRILNTVQPYGYNADAPRLTDTEAAIVKYDTWGWSLEEYAKFFGLTVLTIRHVQYGNSHFHVTREHLPKTE